MRSSGAATYFFFDARPEWLKLNLSANGQAVIDLGSHSICKPLNQNTPQPGKILNKATLLVQSCRHYLPPQQDRLLLDKRVRGISPLTPCNSSGHAMANHGISTIVLSSHGQDNYSSSLVLSMRGFTPLHSLVDQLAAIKYIFIASYRGCQPNTAP